VSNRQLIILIGAVTLLALSLAWAIERTQVRTFVAEFDQWWEAKNGGNAPAPPTD
jgi:hypothetical protein